MKRTGNKNLKIVAATMMTIFSLFTCFSAAAAWFIGVRNQNNDVDNFVVTDIPGRLQQITFHQLTSKNVRDTYALSTFNFSKTAAGTITYNWSTHKPSGTADIVLDGYDYLDHEQPLLMLITLDREYNSSTEGAINITFKTDSENQQYIGARDEEDDNNPKYDLDDPTYIVDTGTVIRDEVEVDVNYYGLSNAAKFYAIEYSEDAFEDAFPEGEANYSFTGLANQKSFVSFTNEQSSFQNNITPLIETTGSVRYIAIIIDYYSDAIEYIYSTFLGDPILEINYDGYLYFKCDWMMEVL